MATRTLVSRVTAIPNANAVSMGLANFSSPKTFFVKNLSASGVSVYIADQTTAGDAPTASTDITADCTNYYTLQSGEEQYVASTEPADLFVQASSSTGTVQITQIN